MCKDVQCSFSLTKCQRCLLKHHLNDQKLQVISLSDSYQHNKMHVNNILVVVLTTLRDYIQNVSVTMSPFLKIIHTLQISSCHLDYFWIKTFHLKCSNFMVKLINFNHCDKHSLTEVSSQKNKKQDRHNRMV